MTVSRLVLMVTVTIGLLGAPPAAEAQQPPNLPRIGFLGTHSPGVTPQGAFQQELRGLGYVEGRNIVIEYRWAEGRAERFADLAAELVAEG